MLSNHITDYETGSMSRLIRKSFFVPVGHKNMNTDEHVSCAGLRVGGCVLFWPSCFMIAANIECLWSIIFFFFFDRMVHYIV